jgi:hypothetical protein
MSTTLNGTWVHQSFRNDLPVRAGTGAAAEKVLAAPWAPPGRFEVSTEADGKVCGELTFPGNVRLSVSGRTHEPIPAGNGVPWPMPGSVELTATIGETEYRLRGWVIPDSNAIAGTVQSVRNDLAQAPDGTMGSWILVKKE